MNIKGALNGIGHIRGQRLGWPRWDPRVDRLVADTGRKLRYTLRAS